jgi:hypothetical protein
MVQIAAGGCGITMFAGATDWVIDDRISVKTDNDGLGLFVVYFDIAFNMYEKGLFLPQAASETINDNLIS